MAANDMIKCLECNGTGAYKPDCYLCEGSMEIPVKLALEEGWNLDELEVYEGEDICRCPSEDCHGDSCQICEGSGEMDGWRTEHEVTRVLITAKSGHIPLRLYRGYWGSTWNDERLSSFAGELCHERNWITWFRSILGDEISLTPAGEAEYSARIFDWHRQHDVTKCQIDIGGRWADDGGLIPEATRP